MINQNYCSVFLVYDAVLLGELFLTSRRICSVFTVRVEQSRTVYWNWLVAFTSLCWCLNPRTVCSRRRRHCSLLKCQELLAQGYGIRPGAAGDLNLSKKNIQAWSCCQHMQVLLFHNMWGCLNFSWNVLGFGHWWRMQSLSQTP